MRPLRTFSKGFVCLTVLFSLIAIRAADPPDTLTLVNGEKLIGKLVRSAGESVIFHSDGAGDVTIPWSKVKEFTSSRRFAVVPKGLDVRTKEGEGKIHHGTVAVTDKSVQIAPGEGQPVQTMTVGDIGFLVDDAAYQRALHNPGFFEDWKGPVTGGISLVKATQKSETFTGVTHLVRAIPSEDWLAPRNRTLVDFTLSYGKVDQPNFPEVKTNLFHFDAERDQYISSNFYALGRADFEHNFSLGLYLQQTYGAGAGWTVIRSDKQTLDLKGTANFISQHFNGQAGEELVGSVFGEVYHRNLPAGIKFDEQLTYIPAWNETSAYSGNAGAGITVPVYKRMGLNISALDMFLNDPPPGFKKNSFQFTTGVTYSLP